MSEWKELKTLQEVAAAQAAGEKIECQIPDDVWRTWIGCAWNSEFMFRSRPRKKTKTIVMREAFYWSSPDGWYQWDNCPQEEHPDFVRYTGNERTEEVEE